MGIFDRFPYSSTHEMNLDFMLGKATEIAEDMQTVTTGMAQVQAGLSAISEKTEQATQAAAQAAQSASSIEGSVAAAEEAAEEAQMHNESAQTWANNALTYKADCQRAATEAAASSSSAAQAATAAAASEDTVAQYAQAANASAQSAANNNDSAHQYANQASASASNATFHSSNAQTAATNAQTAATNAQTAADRAASLKTDVETLHRMCTAAVDQAATEAVNAANSAAQAAATKTDVETLVESLPEDFTDLNNTVNQLSDEIDALNGVVYDFPALTSADFTQGSLYNGNIERSNAKCISTDFFIQIYTPNDGKITIKDVDPNGKWKLRVSFFDASKTFLSQQGYDYFTSVNIPANAKYYKLSISYYVNNVNVDTSPASLEDNCLYVWVSGRSIIDSIKVDLENKENKGIPSELTQIPYFGEKISVKQHCYAFEYFMGLSTQASTTRQGCAVYGNILFLAHDTFNQIDIYDLTVRTRISAITFTAKSSYHCNNINFGSEKYDSADTFPLLYISMENSAERKCLVYRITVSENTYSATLVQTINFPAVSQDGQYYPNAILDTENDLMYIVGYTTNSYQAASGNYIKYVAYRMPKLSDGDITLDYSAKLNEFTIDALTAGQGAFVSNGNIIQVFGTQKALLGQISPGAHAMTTLIDTGIATEPEACFAWNNELYIALVDGTVNKFYFN